MQINKEEQCAMDVTKKYTDKPSRLFGMLILLLLCLYPYIQMIRYIGFCGHKEQVIVERTVCEGLTWDNDNSYYDGVDYLNFYIEVSFKKKEVASFNAHTLVYKDNEFIGYINSDFVGNSQRTDNNSTQYYFEKNTNQKLYFNISHPTNTSWANDELFKVLYNENLDEFNFITNVICVYFTDGTMVGHYLSLSDDFYYNENGVIHYKDQKSDEKRYYYYDQKGKKRYSNK